MANSNAPSAAPAPPPLPSVTHGLDERRPMAARANFREPSRRSEPAKPRASIATLVWSGLGAIAILYLGVVLTQPQLLGRFGPVGGSLMVGGTDDAAPDTIGLNMLHTELAAVKSDLAELQAKVDRSEAHGRTLAQRISSLDGLPPPATDFASDSQPAPSNQPAPGTPPPPLRLESAPVTGPVVSAPAPTAETSPEAPAPASKVANARLLNAPPAEVAKGAAPIETGSVEAANKTAPPFPTPVVTPAPKSWGIQIGSAKSLDGLMLSWSLISESNAQALKGLQPHYSTSVDDTGLVYNLMAGPVTNENDATKACKALSSRAIPCKVVADFSGAAL